MNRLLVILFAVLSVCSFATVDARHRLDIYYSAFDMKTMNFIDELYKAYPRIRYDVGIYFIPFGNAKMNAAGTDFVCDTPSECKANKLHACALDVIRYDMYSQDAQVRFINCEMIESTDETGKECANKVRADFRKITFCMGDRRGFELMKANQAYTQAYGRHGMPTIIFDGSFNPKIQADLLRDFSGTIAKLIYGK